MTKNELAKLTQDIRTFYPDFHCTQDALDKYYEIYKGQTYETAHDKLIEYVKGDNYKPPRLQDLFKGETRSDSWVDNEYRSKMTLWQTRDKDGNPYNPPIYKDQNGCIWVKEEDLCISTMRS